MKYGIYFLFLILAGCAVDNSSQDEYRDPGKQEAVANMLKKTLLSRTPLLLCYMDDVRACYHDADIESCVLSFRRYEGRAFDKALDQYPGQSFASDENFGDFAAVYTSNVMVYRILYDVPDPFYSKKCLDEVRYDLHESERLINADKKENVQRYLNSVTR